jgi:hypothetical protein
MRGTALALVALAATAREARSVPTRFLEGALGSPAVRPPPSPERGSREISFSATVARSETPGASPDLTLSVSSDRQAARDGASTSSKHDLYAHMPSRTTKVGEGSVSAEEIAAKALQVMERLARSAAEREAFAHAPPDGDDERTESTYDDDNDDDDDASLGADGASDAASTPSAPYHFDPEATTEWDDPWDEAYVDDDARYGDDYEYAMVDEAGLGRVFDAEGSALPSMDDGPRGGDARVRFGDERRTSSLPRDGGGGGRRRKADVGYPLAALGDAASETLRGLGADPRASPNRPDAAALGGARKPGSDVFLDDFTRSFEDQWGDDLDAAEAKRAEKARRRRAKAEAAKAEAAKAEAAKAEAERAEAERAEAERAEEAARAARAKARADAKAERRAAVKAAAAEAAAAEKAAEDAAAAEKAAAEKAEARSTAAALGRSRTKTSSSSKTSKTSKTSKSPKPAEAKLAKAKSSTRASSKRSRRRATAPVVDIVDIDDLFDAIERGKVGAASVEPEPEPEPSAGDYGDYDVGDGDDYGDYDDTPETKPEVKRLRGSRKKTSGPTKRETSRRRRIRRRTRRTRCRTRRRSSRTTTCIVSIHSPAWTRPRCVCTWTAAASTSTICTKKARTGSTPSTRPPPTPRSCGWTSTRRAGGAKHGSRLTCFWTPRTRTRWNSCWVRFRTCSGWTSGLWRGRSTRTATWARTGAGAPTAAARLPGAPRASAAWRTPRCSARKTCSRT